MTRTSTSLVALAIAACLLAIPAALAHEGDDHAAHPEATEILRKADAALKAVDSVRCEVEVVPGGPATEFVPEARGVSIMSGWNGYLPARFWAEVEAKAPGSEEATRLTGGGDTDTYFVVDHAAKKGYQDMDPAVMGSHANALRSMGMSEFVLEEPMEDELSAESAEVKGSREIAGVDCWEIEVVYGGDQGRSTWYIAKKDYLPRGRIQYFQLPGGEGSLERRITKLELDPAIDPSLFKMKLPEGYESIDDFAP